MYNQENQPPLCYLSSSTVWLHLCQKRPTLFGKRIFVRNVSHTRKATAYATVKNPSSQKSHSLTSSAQRCVLLHQQLASKSFSLEICRHYSTELYLKPFPPFLKWFTWALRYSCSLLQAPFILESTHSSTGMAVFGINYGCGGDWKKRCSKSLADPVF